MSLTLEQWIMNKEGLKLKPYEDTHGYLSIGYGHNLDANGITLDIAQRMLDADILTAERDCWKNFPWLSAFDRGRQDAIYHLCFWIGIGSLLGFKKMLDAASKGDWQTAHDEVLSSKLFDDIPERATEIAQRILTGDLP